jgi:nicotinamide-nucleotide amidase
MPDPALDSLAEKVGAGLRSAGLLLACAESCTGGWVAQAVTAISGSSEWFDRGFVTYSNDAKREMLDVPATTLDRFGAVSEETARAMAAGALVRSRAAIALAITGVAGPNGGTPAKPVGMVCFAWARRGGNPESKTLRFAGNREEIRRQSVIVALEGVLERVDGSGFGAETER